MNITGLAHNKIALNRMDGYFPPSYPLNYFRLDIKIVENVMSLLLHEYFPYIACATYDNGLQIQFFDHEDVMTALKPYYTVLEAAFLDAPFHPNSHNLSEIELKNAKHWRPNTNGEVIFNCWD
ncbi:hypothetical protein ACIQ2D_21195 [Lysinibacillus sp. NPDC097287]|uniref:hypothetical protein n=1 Tax=Lysinibacillus sp. NPDC097287 TaxID=3364144 RepID=UPI00380AB64E